MDGDFNMEVKWSEADTKKEHAKVQVRKARPIVKALSKLVKYNVGDVVVESLEAKDRYLICHIDKHGMYFARKVTGKKALSKTTYCLCTSRYCSANWQADPDRIDHILLGEEEHYDPSEAIRKENSLKNKVRKHNKSIVIDSENTEVMRKFYNEVSSASCMYITYSFIDNHIMEYRFLEYDDTGGAVFYRDGNKSSYGKYILTSDGKLYDAWGRVTYSGYKIYFQKPKSPKDTI